MAVKGQENLIPCSERSKDETREIGAKGGKASGEARRRKRDIQAAMQALLEKQYKGKDGISLSGAEAISLKQMEKALKGDAKAFELVRDSAGQKPVDKVMVAEVDQTVINEVESMILEEDEE